MQTLEFQWGSINIELWQVDSYKLKAYVQTLDFQCGSSMIELWQVDSYKLKA